jgi:hypothetical protein
MEKDRIGVSDILREMREKANGYQEDFELDWLDAWAAAIEAAMREPFAWWVEDADGYGKWETGGYAVRFKPDTDRPGRTVAPLFAFPPDALETAEQTMDAQDAEIERLRATVSNLERVAMRVHNFPSHPGGHKDDRSDEAMVPEDWRHGWICAVAAMQESVMEAQQADHTQSDTVSDRVRSDTIQNDKENKP